MHEFQWKKNIIDNAAITCMTIIVLLLIAAVYKLIIFKLNPNLCIATSIKVYTCSMNLSRGGGGGGEGGGGGGKTSLWGVPKSIILPTHPTQVGGCSFIGFVCFCQIFQTWDQLKLV